ncbi:MAG: CinA family protein [Rhodobiaceae bacterium]|nr:CinA family protein [Rhodobiaceae bacterium]
MSDIGHCARALFEKLRDRQLTMATAESCTGGMVAAAMTDIPGSSVVFERGFVTYSNQAKTEMLGVPAELVEKYGAVSEPVAIAMAEGALARSAADVAVSITGIAGPGGGTAAKPVGLVHFGAARRGGVTRHERMVFPDNGRDAIRRAAAEHALSMLLNLAEGDQAVP